ncbi:hypothetical protein ENBRE01_3197 [Enteropsectra breve]|nr:hypothetical protein ENBRE01_2834 [Enteropsectra breve]KAI5153458.1 hypothetical protein ENBRE01_3197 [Enteropsectra breve]
MDKDEINAIEEIACNKEINMNELKIFTYRFSHSMNSFHISDKHIFVINEREILRYHHNDPLPTVFSFENATVKYPESGFEAPKERDLVPLSSVIHMNTLYLTTKKGMYCLDETFVYLRPCEALSVDECFGEYILSCCENGISVFSTKSKKIANEIRINNTNGICSAVFVFKNDVYFGFENGKIFKIEDFDPLLKSKIDFSEHVDNRRNIVEIAKTKEPVLSLFKTESCLLVTTFKNRVIKIKEDHQPLYTEFIQPSLRYFSMKS